MKRIDEKVDISGDGAELIQKYLNELNMKLLAAGITESYSIVMEAETLFISEINDLNKKSKVTIFEIQKIIEKHGTPDEIVKRYKKATEAEMEEEFFSIDPTSRELIRRSTNLNSDIEKLKNNIYYGFGIITLVLPPILLTLSLIHLNQYEGSFIVFTFLLDVFSITDDQAIGFVVLSLSFILFQEIYTGRTGKLYISMRNTIRFRTLNRAILLGGAFASFMILRIHQTAVYLSDNSDADRFRVLSNIKGYVIPYSKDILEIWIISFIILEIVILVRDHVSSLYPLQPRFTPYMSYLKVHYILWLTAVGFFLLSVRTINQIALSWSILFMLMATLVTSQKGYSPGIRFYVVMQLIPLLSVLMFEAFWIYIYIEFLLITAIVSWKYRVEMLKIGKISLETVK
jgi:hypothetical protein